MNIVSKFIYYDVKVTSRDFFVGISLRFSVQHYDNGNDNAIFFEMLI